MSKFSLGILPNVKGNMNLTEALAYVDNLNNIDKEFWDSHPGDGPLIFNGQDWVRIQ